MSFSPEEIEEFTCEALEMLDAAEDSLLKIAEGLPFAEGYESIFRCFHNLKGGAGMMEMEKLQAHTHELENILVSLKGKSELTTAQQNLFLKGIDAARHILRGEEVAFDISLAEDKPQKPASPTGGDMQELLHLVQPEEKKLEIPQSAIDEFLAEADEIADRFIKALSAFELDPDKALID